MPGPLIQPLVTRRSFMSVTRLRSYADVCHGVRISTFSSAWDTLLEL